jgi:hypothetical protein
MISIESPCVLLLIKKYGSDMMDFFLIIKSVVVSITLGVFCPPYINRHLIYHSTKHDETIQDLLEKNL